MGACIDVTLGAVAAAGAAGAAGAGAVAVLASAGLCASGFSLSLAAVCTVAWERTRAWRDALTRDR